MLMERSHTQTFALRQDRPRERASAMALTLLVYAVFGALLIIFRNEPLPRIKIDERLNTITIAPPEPPPPPPPPARLKPKAAKAGGSPSMKIPSPQPILVPQEVAPAVISPIVDVPKTDMGELGASSMAALTPPPKLEGPAEGIGEKGTGTGNTKGQGKSVVYDVHWKREPTLREILPFLPRGAPSKGWGIIICRMIDNSRVANCVADDEFPKGSGIAEALRNASGTLRIVPPSVDGKPEIGGKVRIKLGY